GAVVRHEHEPGTHAGLGALRPGLDRPLDLLRRPARRDAGRRRAVSPAAGARGRVLRQAASREPEALHLLRGAPAGPDGTFSSVPAFQPPDDTIARTSA